MTSNYLILFRPTELMFEQMQHILSVVLILGVDQIGEFANVFICFLFQFPLNRSNSISQWLFPYHEKSTIR
jgi:hypothetical protein